MQFRGHSLPVHHSAVYHGNFSCSSHLISQFPPTRFPPVASPWMAFLAGSKGQNITIVIEISHIKWHRINTNTRRKKWMLRLLRELYLKSKLCSHLLKNKTEKNSWQELKNKQIINTYINEQHHGIKRTNLCGIENCQCWNQCSPKEHKKNFKTWMGNKTGNIDKKST